MKNKQTNKTKQNNDLKYKASLYSWRDWRECCFFIFGSRAARRLGEVFPCGRRRQKSTQHIKKISQALKSRQLQGQIKTQH